MRIERLGYYSSEEVRDFLTPGGAADLSDTYVTDSTFAENVDDRVAALLQAGSNILLTYDDPPNTLRIGVTFTATGRFLGRISALGGNAEELTGTQATSLLDPATTDLKGLMSSADKTKLDKVGSGEINAIWEGADPTGVASSVTALQNAAILAMTQKKTLVIPDGEYKIDAALAFTLTNHLTIKLGKRAILKATSACTRMISVYAEVADTYVYDFTLSGGYFDGSAIPNSPAGQAWDVWGFFGARRVDASEFYIYQGADYRTAGSDSGIFCVSPSSSFRDFTIEGSWDAGIYYSGDSANSVGKDGFVTNGRFLKCNVGIISKRTFKRYHLTNIRGYQCGTLIATGEAGTGYPPGTENVIDDVVAVSCINPISLRISDYTRIRNIYIHEYGFDLDGVAATNATGIALLGSKFCRVSNVFVRQTTTNSTHIHVLLQSRTNAADGLVYHSTDNVVHGIEMIGGHRGIIEADANQNRNRIFDYTPSGLASEIIRRSGPDQAALIVDEGTYINGFEVKGAATGLRPLLQPRGSDANISFDIRPKGTGTGFLRDNAGGQVLNWSGSGVVLAKPLYTFASAAGASGLRIPHGVAPTTPANGDTWTTTGGFFTRINGATASFSGVNTGDETSVTLASKLAGVAGEITSSSPTAGLGYATGAGGSVTQITSKTTTVTLNTMCGQITTADDALAAGAFATFAINNSNVDGNDTIILNIGQGGATGQNYRFWVAGVDAGVFYITLENRSAGSLSEAVRFNFTVIKGVTV